jgi:subtilisin family serine protease
MELNYKLFKGVSVLLDDVEKADDTIMRIAEANSNVKNVWPLQVYSIPKPTVEWIGKPDIETSDLKKRQDDGNQTVGDFAPHVMTQIDKLHKKGITGKGIKIAVIDTGVSELFDDLAYRGVILNVLADRLYSSSTRKWLLRRGLHCRNGL